MQDQQHLEHQSSATPLNENGSSSNECVDHAMEGDPVTRIDQHRNVKEEESDQYNSNDKENIYPEDQEDINENSSEDQQSGVEVEDGIETHVSEEARQDAITQTPELSKEKSAKARNSLLLVQEFHTGLTSGDDSGESEMEVDEARETIEKTEDECEQSSAGPADPAFVTLKAFKPDHTYKEAIERNKNLSKYGLLFTRDEHEYYMGNTIVNPPTNKEDAAYHDEVEEILAMIAEKEKKWDATPMDQRKRKPRNSALEPEAKRAKSGSPSAEVLASPLQPYFDLVIPDPGSVILDSKEASPTTEYNSSPSQSSMAAEDTPPPPAPAAVSKPKAKPNPPLAVLDTVLSSILRDSQQAQQKAKANELSDLEAAALAAGLDLNPNGGAANDKCGPQSKLSKQEHKDFLRYNETLKKVGLSSTKCWMYLIAPTGKGAACSR